MRTIAILVLPCLFLATALGQAAETKLHASHKIAEKYLTATHLHQWSYAVKMIEKKSLENLKRIQKRFLQNAPTMSAEEDLLRLLGMTEISDIDGLSAEEVFIRRAKANTARLPDPEKRIARIKATLQMRTLSTAAEGSDMVHALVRVRYETVDRSFSELALVSLTKEGTVWKVSLDAQEPKIVRIDPKSTTP